jgi:hypothetical protein
LRFVLKSGSLRQWKETLIQEIDMARFTYAWEGREKIRRSDERMAQLDVDEVIYGETVAINDSANPAPRCCNRPMVEVGRVFGSPLFDCECGNMTTN